MRLIDADEAVKAVHDEFDECLVWDESGEATANEFENIILQMPTVDPVKHGHWKGKPIAGYSTVRCSECGDVFMENNGKWNYCPDCGAKMDEVAE